jgi:hypothetical protein
MPIPISVTILEHTLELSLKVRHSQVTMRVQEHRTSRVHILDGLRIASPEPDYILLPEPVHTQEAFPS